LIKLDNNYFNNKLVIYTIEHFYTTAKTLKLHFIIIYRRNQ